MAEESVEEERRRILAKSLPFMLNAVWEAHTALSPANLAAVAATQYQTIEKNAKLKEEEIKSLTRDIGHLNLQVESTGRLSLTLTRMELLELVGNYLVAQFLTEGSVGADFAISPSYPEYEGILSLPNRAVFAKLVEDKVEQSWIFDQVDKAMTLNPSEVWIFTYGDQRFDVRFDPVFISENSILRGRFRLLPVTDSIEAITKGRFSATIEVGALPDKKRTHFLLTRMNG